MAFWNKEIKESDWRKQEIWEDYPTPNYKAKHTYCQVAFDDSDQTFYYRTRNPEHKEGDTVIVPIGYKGEKRTGKIVSMKEYKGTKVPYPLEKTRYIKQKVKKENGYEL